MPEDIIISQGGELTIKGTVWMNEYRHIIVEKGGILRVDGGILTNSCENKLWGGVIVKGTYDQPQNLIYQGMISVRNEGTIKNAIIGIHSTNSTDKQPATGGGIITTNLANFENNKVAVQMEPYSLDNIANFVLTEFKIDKDFISVLGEPEKSVILNEVSRVKFLGCEFLNEYEVNKFTGLYSYISNFFMDCYGDEPNSIKTSLKAFKYGIKAYGSYSKSISIKNSIFIGNQTGIYTSSVFNPLILLNEFTVNSDIDGCGLYLNSSSGFSVEANNFKSLIVSVPQTNTRGIIINNSGKEDNTIYHNKFFGLEYAITAENINRDLNGDKGLQILCNEFNKCEKDISITNNETGSVYGIKSQQGSAGNSVDCTAPAGNLFSKLNLSMYPNYKSIVNNCNRIDYYYHRNYPLCVPSPNVGSVFANAGNSNYNPETCCPPIAVTGGSGTIDPKSLLYKDEADSINYQLNQLIDDGNTNEKIFSINTSIPDESMEIHNELLVISPFLSDTVIERAINKENVLNNAMIRDIMVANPHSAKSDELLVKLSDRVNPMPEYLLEEILEGLDTLSMKELMEAQVNYGYSMYKFGFDRLIAETLADTTISKYDSVAKILDQDGSFSSKLRKGWIKFELGDTLLGLQFLDSLLLSNELNIEQINELSENYQLMEWLANNPIIDSTTLQNLIYFENSNSQYVSSRARDIMVNKSLINYEEPYLVPDLTKSEEVKEVHKNYVKSTNTYIKVYPNPGKDYITIEYNIGIDIDQSNILIYDEIGKLIESVEATRQNDQMIFNLKSLKSGNYFVQLVINGNLASSTQFTKIN